MRQQVQFLNIF